MARQDEPILFKLLQLGALIQSSIASYVEHDNLDNESLSSNERFNAQRAILAAAGSLTELFSDPSSRLLEVSSQYFEARALHIVANQRIPDILAKGGEKGVDLLELASSVGIETKKLGKCTALKTWEHLYCNCQ